MTLVLVVTVSAGAVELAEVVDGEVGNGDGTATVVLDDLVVGALSTTTDDVKGAVTGLEGEGVYSNQEGDVSHEPQNQLRG